MNLGIDKYLAFSVLLCTSGVSVGQASFEKILMTQIAASGWRPSAELYRNPDEGISEVGRKIFESESLSLNGNISCRTCHQDKFGTSDGIPNAAATGEGRLAVHGGGRIVGPDRLMAGAKLLPRHVLPFWGRGGVGFETFFWEGKVDFSEGKEISQFGAHPPSEDALVVAVHLPVVEIREMLNEDEFVTARKKESVEQAKEVYAKISSSLQRDEPQASQAIAGYLNKSVGQLQYTDYARAVAAFIRSEFRVKPTKLEHFMSGKETLSQDELRGGIIFYGRGGCVLCHSGAYFSDFKFHLIPFPQLGFGKNGFGVDYGRYNTTFDTNDLYKFRTPPLYNVEKTSPYGHSGSVKTMEGAILAHTDPLRLVDLRSLDGYSRHEYYTRLSQSGEVGQKVSYLSDADVSQVVAFLRTLSF
jgi:cytochrome c peroxidase